MTARSAGARDTPRRTRTRARERRLRRLVAASRGCLAALPAAERRVLVLRAGLGPRDPRVAPRDGRAARRPARRRAPARARRAAAPARLRRRRDRRARHDGGGRRRPRLDHDRGQRRGRAAVGGGDGGPDAGGVLGESESSPRTGGAPDEAATVLPGAIPAGGGDASVFVLAGLAAMLIALLATRRSREWILHPDD